jgi:hypothetical protein
MQQRQSVDSALRRIARRRHRLHSDVYTLISKLYSICALAHVRAKPSRDGVHRVPAAVPRQSVIPPIGFLYLPPKVIRVGGPAKGDRTEFRSYFAIAWKLVSAVSMPSVGWYGYASALISGVEERASPWR